MKINEKRPRQIYTVRLHKRLTHFHTCPNYYVLTTIIVVIYIARECQKIAIILKIVSKTIYGLSVFWSYDEYDDCQSP